MFPVGVVLIVTAGTVASGSPDVASLVARAQADYARPLRPGLPGKVPFWNKYSRRFMFAPAFDFRPLEGARGYRFTVISEASRRVFRFTARQPWASLSPIWNQVPVGWTRVVVEALDAKGRPFATVGQRRFWRAAGWDGLMPEPARSYRESARRGLRFLFREKHVQRWLKDGQPDPSYPLYCYPSKVMGALTQAMVLYSKLAPPDEATTALAIARRVADFLISISYGPDAAYPYFPPTYRGKSHTAGRFAGQLMMFYPTRAAEAYLDLYDATGDKKYYEAALRIADTYVRTQKPSGSWPLKAMAKTGKPMGPNICVPIWMVSFFDRLVVQYGLKSYRQARDKAWQWIVDNPMKTYNWQAQFEDVEPMPPYKNLARDVPCLVAEYLFTHFASDAEAVAQARELLRFAEDQFVVWKNPLPGRSTRDKWFLPGVLEQYVFYVPIDASAAQMVLAWNAGYRATGDKLYLAKLRAMANQITRVQDSKTGFYPTFWWPRQRTYWINCALWDATAMLRVADLYGK